jgi:hypothetical protein
MSLPCPATDAFQLADLKRALPQNSLYGNLNQDTDTGVGWLLSPTPYALSPDQADQLHQIGLTLHQFAKALDLLYRSSISDPALFWIHTLFSQGKPQALLNFSQMNRFKNHLPFVIRPDLLVTEKGFVLCEIDAVPGGIGFTGALYQAYQQMGFHLRGISTGIPQAFMEALLASTPSSLENPQIAVLVSDEAADYRQELQWLVDSIQRFYPKITLLHPKEMTLIHQQLGFTDSEKVFQPVQIIYRFFELFDLPNIPQIELIQYAIKKGFVYCTPPFKPHLEEKLSLALVHYPFLRDFWTKTMGQTHFDLLKSIVPESWILDPTPIPQQGQIIPSLSFQEHHLRDFSGLTQLTQKQRMLVIKPSGFSPLAWGSRGVKIGHDLSQDDWQVALHEAFTQFHQTPHLLQRFEKTKVEPYQYFHPETGEIIQSQGRTRLCPYYFVQQDEPHLAGVLATTCPQNKKIIHGMKDGVMRPVIVV